jgi:hypothetical protein
MANENSCGDGYCVLLIGPRAGQHTNGGCHCLREIPLELRRRIIRKLRADRDQLTAWSQWADELRKVYVQRDTSPFSVESFAWEGVARLLRNRPDKEE